MTNLICGKCIRSQHKILKRKNIQHLKTYQEKSREKIFKIYTNSTNAGMKSRWNRVLQRNISEAWYKILHHYSQGKEIKNTTFTSENRKRSKVVPRDPIIIKGLKLYSFLLGTLIYSGDGGWTLVLVQCNAVSRARLANVPLQFSSLTGPWCWGARGTTRLLPQVKYKTGMGWKGIQAV